jgi:hypothetical protein
MTVGLLVVSGLLAAAPAVVGLDVRPEPYREAMRAGAVGSLTGGAMMESRRPGAPREPITPLGVTLLPRSEALLEQLSEIRRRARDDPQFYRTSARAVVEARRTLERSLTDAGGADLFHYLEGGPDGTFELDRLPAGAWILLAQHAVYIAKPSPGLKKRDKEVFQRQPRMTGYYAVTIWVQELAVTPGGVARVELTDRNAWMTAIEEERVLDTGR